MKPNFSRTKRTRGSVLIEFAITISILLTIVLAAIEFGWALSIRNELIDAARLSVRVAVTQNVPNSTIITAATNLLSTSMNIPANKVTITLTPSTPSTSAQGSTVTVQISVPYSSVSILPAPLFLKNVTLSEAASMVKEY